MPNAQQRESTNNECTHLISDSEMKKWKPNNIMTNSERVPKEKQVTLSWCRLNAFVTSNRNILSIMKGKDATSQKHILKNVNGSAKPGELLVIMGSSGAGKTTLLNCLTFRNLKNLTISGLVGINGKLVTQTQLSAISAYVQQDDLFIGYLTVKEQLLFQSMLRMEAHYTSKERKQRVEEIMIEVGILQDWDGVLNQNNILRTKKDNIYELLQLSLKKCENCQIGIPGVIKGISGGERKRLALAGEFLTNPSILFCDEPTTGLDSFMALSVVQLLSDIAKRGRTVVTTLHQPSSELYQLFDKLCLMANGRTAFLGTTMEASIFFKKLSVPCPKNFNPADHYIQLLSIIPGCEESCKKSVQAICDAFESSRLGDASLEIMKCTKKIDGIWIYNKGLVNPYRVGWFPQFRAVLWRTWLSSINNPDAIKNRFLLVFIETFFITIIYYGQKLTQSGITNLDGVFFFLLSSTSYQNVFAVVNTLCGEIPLFIKEHKDGMYRTDVYYLCKVITALPISVSLACFTTSMCYYAVGLNPEFSRYLTAVGLTMLVALCSEGLGFIVSTVSPSYELSPLIVSITISPLLILGGIYLNIKSIPSYLQWLSDLSWFKYAYQAYMINQWSDVPYIECSHNLSVNSMCITDGIEVLHKQTIRLGEFWIAIVSLISLAILFRIMGYLILLIKVSNVE